MRWIKKPAPASDELDLSDFPQAHWWWLQDKDRGTTPEADDANGLILSYAALSGDTERLLNFFAALSFNGFTDEAVRVTLSENANNIFGNPDVRAEKAVLARRENDQEDQPDDVIEALKVLTDNEAIVAPILSGDAQCEVGQDPTEPWEPKAADAKVIIGVIDDGIAIANGVFRTSSETAGEPDTSRVHSLWQQDAKCVKSSADQPFGRIYLKDEIDEALSDATHDGNLNETEFYRHLDLGMRGEPPGRFPGNLTHGVHVAGLAAGTVRQAREVTDNINAEPEKCPILAVNLPTAVVRDTAGSFMAAAVVLGIRNILETAEQINGDAPVVINLSFALLGSGLGGANLIARYIDVMTEQWKKKGRTLVVVLPAGNNYNDALVGQMTVPAGGTGPARFEIDATNASPTFVEFVVEKQKAFTGLSDVRLELVSDKQGTVRTAPTAPSEMRSSWTLWANPNVDKDLRAAVYYGFRFEEQADPAMGLQGREVVTLALPPNRSKDGHGTLDVNGVWTARLHNSTSENLDFTVRILRNDDPVGDALRQSARLLNPEEPDGAAMTITKESTLNAIANSSSAVVVGGSYVSHDGMTTYSSSGPTTSLVGGNSSAGVDVNAPSERNHGTHGLLGPGAITDTHDGRSKRLAGTSVAAPLVTRWLANYFATNAGATSETAIAALKAVAIALPRPDVPTGQTEKRTGEGSLPKKYANP